MGIDFANLQVRISSDGALAAVERAVVAVLGRDKYVRVEDGKGERCVYLAHARGGDWVALFDQGVEEGTVAVDDLAARVSKAVDSHAFSVRVEDSAVLELQLFERGQHRDTWNTRPGYGREIDDEDREACAGKPERWHPLLAGEDAKLQFERMLRQPNASWNQHLSRVAELLGIRLEQLVVGAGHAGTGELPADVVGLSFAKATAASYEARATGAPDLSIHDRRDHETFIVGKRMFIALDAENRGGESRGLDIRVSGSAVERGLVTVRSAMSKAAPAPGWDLEGERPPAANGGFSFPEQVLPAACTGDLAALQREHPAKARHLRTVSMFSVGVSFEARAAGTGDVRVELAPLSNSEANPEAKTSTTFTVTIDEPLPAPLLATKSAPAHSLEALRARSHLVLLVSCDVPVADAARFFAERVRAWLKLVAPEQELHAILPRAPGYTDVDPSALEALFRDNEFVAADTSTTPPPFGASGTGFGVRALAKKKEVPTLGLWTEAISDEALVWLQQTAARAMDELHGAQAIVTRWGRVPFMSLERTIYEEVSPAVAGNRLTRANLTRFVRAVSPGDLWLGQELAERVDTTALSRTADVTKHGATLRVRIPDDPARVRAVEEALRMVLPGSRL